MIRDDDARVRAFAPQNDVASALPVHDESDAQKILTSSWPEGRSVGHGVAGGNSILNVEICGLADVPDRFLASIALRDATGERGDEGDTSAIRLLFENNCVTHGLRLHSAAQRPTFTAHTAPADIRFRIAPPLTSTAAPVMRSVALPPVTGTTASASALL